MDYGSTDAQRQKHLLLKSTSPTGIVQEYTYDASGNATSTKISAAGTAAFMKTTAAYTANRNYPVSKTDARGKTVTSQIDVTKGTLTSVTDPAGQTVAYAYDNLKRLTSATAVAGGNTFRNEYVYTYDRLTQVKHNTTSDTACAYLLTGVFGGYKNVSGRKSACSDVFALSSVEQIVPGMELFQGDKHVGKALMWDFGSGYELAVFHSSTGNGGQGPVLDRLTDLGNWTHAGTPTNQGGASAFFLDPRNEWYVF